MLRALLSLLFLAVACAASPAQTISPANLKSNLSASVAPAATDDASKGYSQGSLWQNSSTGQIWINRDPTANAAVWTQMELSDHPGYVANNWYIPQTFSPLSAGSAPGAGSIRLYPAFIKERITISALGVRVNTVSAGGNVQAALYANNPATMRPTGAALASTSSMSTAIAQSVSAAVSLQIEPGMYWFATNCDNGVAIFTAANSNYSGVSAIIGSATQDNALQTGGALVGLSVSQAFGTWPNLTAASFTEIVGLVTIPLAPFKIGSVP